MFIRVTKAKTRNYVVIARAYRDQNGKPKQKVVKNLGFFNSEAEKEKLYTIGKNLIANMEGKELFVGDASNIRELGRENWGATTITNKIFELYKLDKLLSDCMKKRKVTYDLSATLKFLVANRFLDPKSKLAAFANKDYMADCGDFDLHHLYRSLDELYNYQDQLKEHLVKRQQELHQTTLNAVLFDVTTIYFESQKADDLKEFGYSKDCKFNEVQIVLSLILTSDGIPIGFEVFPGNQHEGGTLLPALVTLKERYNIKDVIIVADRGLSSFNNLQAIKDHGFNYIIASRIGNMSAAERARILDDADYQNLSSNEDDVVRYKSLDFNRVCSTKDENGNKKSLSEKLLCLYSSKRARKDASDRLRLITKAQEMLDCGGYRDKRGAKKYLKMDKQVATGLHLDKIAAESKFDGYYAISYSKTELEPSFVANTYRSLWQIEASFRNMKHFFSTRPMFHWTAKRIHGHIMLNFLCLVFENYLEQKLTNKEHKYSPERFRNAISGLERSELRVGDKKVISYAALTKEQLAILTALKIPQPQNH